MLTGVLSLSFFIHNGALSILRNQRRPENNVRDIIIAYVLVCLTYLIVGKKFIFFINTCMHMYMYMHIYVNAKKGGGGI